jgi:nucleotide-binding universal stress UspA family protein
MKLFDRILAATDFSPASAPAVAQAVRIAGAVGAELFLVNAYESPGAMTFGPYVASATLYDEIEAALRGGAEKGLRPLAEQARKAGVQVTSEVVRGVPSLAITEAARAHHADLIVMGTHGRGGISQFFLGSVAQRVIATAPCPVLTVRDASGALDRPRARGKRPATMGGGARRRPAARQ